MPDLSFRIEGAEVTPYAMVPLLTFALRVTNTPAHEAIQNVVLRCQIQIEATKRQYGPAEEGRLLDLFGARERWGQTLRSMLWTHASTVVPPFAGEAVTELPVPCTYDFNVAATKYFAACSRRRSAISTLNHAKSFCTNPAFPRAFTSEITRSTSMAMVRKSRRIFPT